MYRIIVLLFFKTAFLEAFVVILPKTKISFKATTQTKSNFIRFDTSPHNLSHAKTKMNNRSSNYCDEKRETTERREWFHRMVIFTANFICLFSNNCNPVSAATGLLGGSTLELVTDPQTYSSVLYTPPREKTGKRYPLLIVLPGAGTNHNDMNDDEEKAIVWKDITSDQGEHFGLPINLLAQRSSSCPKLLAEEFMVVTPYAPSSKNNKTRSFYNEPRSSLLLFLQYILTTFSNEIDPDQVFLFGFSDGATVAVELATTRKFKACIIAAYGYTGTLPSLALQRLKGIPFWIFHSADDVIFPVACGDNLVQSLRRVNQNDNSNGDINNIIKYTRYERDQEGYANTSSPLRGHSVGMTASKQKQIYEWLLAFYQRE